jgi:phage protein D
MSTFKLDGLALQVMVNGSLIGGLLHASIVSSNCFSADSYALTLATGAPPLADIAFWSALPTAYVQIRANTADGLSSQDLISGMIDTIRVDPIRATVMVEGRDLSSLLIDSYRQQDFVNQTASEVTSIIAANHNLIPVVTATSGNVGRYYSDGYTRLSIGQFSRLRSDWDLIVQLARENSCDAFVQGTSLFFRPSNSSGKVPIYLAFRDLKNIHFEQTLSVASDSGARVQSWNSQNMAAYGSDVGNQSSTAAFFDPAAARSQPFLFSGSNFTAQQVEDSATRYAAEVERLTLILHAEMPWDLKLSPRALILVDESNSAFDTTYEIDHVERHYSTTSGSSQIIRAVVS